MTDTKRRFGHLIGRMTNTALAIHPGKAEVILAAVADRLGIASIDMGSRQIKAMSGEDWDDEGETYSEPGYEVALGIAKIDIEGTLVMKLGSLRPYSGMTGYDGIKQNLIEAAQDRDVKAILLDIDSPGGEVAGMFRLAEAIRAVDQGIKPVFGVLTESAYSAAYLLASATRRIYVPRTGGTGSIGVVCAHCDVSQALKAAGLKVTFLYDGDQKVDAAAELPLSDDARDRIMKDIRTMGSMFRMAVAQNRGLSEAIIRDMQAGTFLGADGVTAGLADEVMDPDAAFQDILDRVG
jgi:signal peptide peptidase SppA